MYVKSILKKIIFSLLFLCLIIGIRGLSISKHYCGEMLASISLTNSTNDCCDSEEEDNDCCHNEHNFYKLNENLISKNHLLSFVPSDFFNIILFTDRKLDFYTFIEKKIDFRCTNVFLSDNIRTTLAKLQTYLI